MYKKEKELQGGKHSQKNYSPVDVVRPAATSHISLQLCPSKFVARFLSAKEISSGICRAVASAAGFD